MNDPSRNPTQQPVTPSAGTEATSPSFTGPSVLGDFELREEIGRGGMGIVYRAWQRSLRRVVAVKILSHQVSSSPKSVVRFQREAQAAAKLHHAHIVPIFGLGEDHGVYYYAMEFVDGPGLNTIIERGGRPAVDKASASDLAETLPLPRAVRPKGGVEAPGGIVSSSPAGASASRSVGASGGDPSSSRNPASSGAPVRRAEFVTIARHVASIADALHYAHGEGVIHRDVKPHNLILGADGKMRISDFGLARLVEQPGVTITGEMIGSPLYMSSEQITGDTAKTDHRTDIYSLGATLYEWLTCTPPYPGQTREQVISRILTTEAPLLRAHNPLVPVDLETICMKAIERDPDRRYRTAGELRDDLTRFVENRPIKARRANLAVRVVKLISRHQVASIATAATILLAVLGWSLIRSGQNLKSQIAAAELAREDSQRLAEDFRRLASDPRVRDLIPMEIETPLRAAEAASPFLQDAATRIMQDVVASASGETSGADPARAGTASGITRRVAKEFYEAIAPDDWLSFTPGGRDELLAEARRAVELWDSDPNDAVTAINRYLQEHGDHFHARQYRAALLGRLGKGDEMLKDARALVKLRPHDAYARTWRGLAHLLLGDTASGLSDLMDGEGTAPAGTWRLTLRGLVLITAKQATEAIAAFDKALASDPDLVVAHLGRACAHLAAGDQRAAIGELNRVIEMEADNADAIALRGDLYAQLDEYGAAAADYDRAMSIAGRTTLMIMKSILLTRPRPEPARKEEAASRSTSSAGDAGSDEPVGKTPSTSAYQRMIRFLLRGPAGSPRP